MIETSCHCGAVRMQMNEPPPSVTDCNCSICRRLGVLWAYYKETDVRIKAADGATRIYMWDDRAIEFHTCRICGCTTHWWAVDRTRNRMGINARLMEPEVLAGLRVRKLDGANTEKYLDEP